MTINFLPMLSSDVLVLLILVNQSLMPDDDGGQLLSQARVNMGQFLT